MRSTMCLFLMAALLTGCSASLPLSTAPTPAPRQPITIQFHLVDEAPDSERPALVDAHTGEQVHLINPPVLDQADITEATLQPDSVTGMYNVQLDFTVPGSQKLADATARNVGKRLAIVVDRQLLVAPTIYAALSGTAVISGNFTREAAQDIVDRINGSAP